MERPLEKPDTSTSYLEFFGLTQPPFAKVSQPSEIFHTDQNALLMAHLTNATEQPDCLVVICGTEGSGKTALLNSYISGLGNQVSFAIIDETCAGEVEFYGAFLKQIGFTDITGTPNELRHITNQFLVNRGMAGDPVLIVIDNAERLRPTVLEQLRWISAITVEDRRVLSVVLAGNSHLAHVISSPAMTQIKFNNQVHFNVRRYSEYETAKYVWQRLWWAGGAESVKISDETYPLIFRYTGGVARQINMLCNDVLCEARALESRVITASLVRNVANRRQLLPHVVPLHGKGRRKTDSDFRLAQTELQAEEIATAPDTATRDKVQKTVPVSYASAVGGEDLREQLSSLREQISDLTADKLRALQDVSMRDEDITELRNRLHAQTAETKKLASALKSNSDEIRRQNHALADSTKALQESEEATKKLAADLEKERIAAKTAQADIAKAEARADELGQLRDKLDAQTAKTEDLAKALESNADEIERQNQALDDSTKALHASEEAAEKLAADLEKKRVAAQTAQAEIEKARARTEELGELRDKLDAQTAEIEKLTNALESNAGEIRRQNHALTDSTEALQESERAAVKLAADLENERVAAKTAQTDIARANEKAEELSHLKTELQAAIGDLTADLKQAEGRVFEVDALENKLIESVPACQTLKEYDQATYNCLITTCEHMFRQNYSEQQIEDALRVQQAELIERRVPKASDKAVINYARLIVDQLREYKIHGADLCFGMLVPQTGGGHDGSPAISRRTREREYALLELTLRTYNEDMAIPTEEDVWPYLEPIFLKLFEAYGEANVSAQFDFNAPNADKEMTSNISMSLYRAILKLRKMNAATALRWLLSP